MGEKYNESTGYSLNPVSKRWERTNKKASSSSHNKGTVSEVLQETQNENNDFIEYSTDELKDILVSMEEKEASHPMYDEVRTELCSRAIKDSKKEKVSSHSAVKGLSEPGSGMTADMISGTSVEHGFPYSPYPERSVAVHYKDITAQDLDNYVENNRDILSEPGNFLGLWHDPDSGLVYIDISVVTDDASKAREECLEKDQLAFFDLQTFQTVTVNEDATSGGANKSSE